MLLTYLGQGTYRCVIGGQQHVFQSGESKIFPSNYVSEIEKLVDDNSQLSMAPSITVGDIPTLVETISKLTARITLLENPSVADIAVLPVSGAVSVPEGGSLSIEVQPDGQDFFSLEVDHSLQGILPEFSVYASESNPYGTEEEAQVFLDAGVTVTYSKADGKWTIDFGQTVTDIFRTRPNITFYFVVKDGNGNNIWGSMSPTTPENTRTYSIA